MMNRKLKVSLFLLIILLSSEINSIKIKVNNKEID
jgi:hypothetical protein